MVFTTGMWVAEDPVTGRVFTVQVKTGEHDSKVSWRTRWGMKNNMAHHTPIKIQLHGLPWQKNYYPRGEHIAKLFSFASSLL